MKTSLPDPAERRVPVENQAPKILDADRGQSKDGEFPVFSVSKDSPPITLETVKAALDDDF
jgi:hypothetical protein